MERRGFFKSLIAIAVASAVKKVEARRFFEDYPDTVYPIYYDNMVEAMKPFEHGWFGLDTGGYTLALNTDNSGTLYMPGGRVREVGPLNCNEGDVLRLEVSGRVATVKVQGKVVYTEET